jgi:CBS domain containing-hemolysin-like protein
MSRLHPSDELFDEARLRRALRLEASELPSRIDLVAIAAQAEVRPAFVAASLLSTALTCLAGAALLGLAVAALPAIAPALASDLFASLIDALARAAILASSILGAVQQPALPIAALAALGVAIAYEYAQRRERVREVTS